MIPETATLSGTVRAMKRETLTLVEQAMRRIVGGVALGFGAQAEVDFRLIFAPLVNHPRQTHAIADAAAELVGDDNVNRQQPPATGVGGFRIHAGKVPGAYINLGNGDSAPAHNHHYNFNDEAIPFGSALFARLVERQLPRGTE